MYVVQIIYGETLQEAAEVPAENLRKLIPKASAPKKNRALWCRSHKCATSMAEVPSKCHKKAQSKKRKPGPSKRHKKSQVEAQEEDEAEEDEAAPGPSKRHKVENKSKACPTIEEVEEKLRQEMEEENADPYDETLVQGLQDHSKAIPVFFNHPAVRFFCDIKKRNGQKMLIESSGWGEFVLMSENDFEKYESFKNNIPENLLILDSTLEYFLSVCVKERVEVLYYTDCIVRLVPSNVSDQYKKWREEAKCRLHLD